MIDEHRPPTDTNVRHHLRIVFPVGIEVDTGPQPERITVNFDERHRLRVAARLENLADALRRWEPFDRHVPHAKRT